MTLLAVGGLGGDDNIVFAHACMHAYYSLYNHDYFMGLISWLVNYLQDHENWTPQNLL